MLCALRFPAPIARMTVAAPVTMSPPAHTPGWLVRPSHCTGKATASPGASAPRTWDELDDPDLRQLRPEEVVERLLGRAIMSRFHAGFSVGTVAGALIGAAMVALDVPVTAHLLGVAVVVGVAVPLTTRGFVPDVEMDKVVPSSEWVKATGPRWTAVLADPARILHRASPAEDKDRYSVTFTWTSRNPIKTMPAAEPFTADEDARIRAGLTPAQLACLPA